PFIQVVKGQEAACSLAAQGQEAARLCGGGSRQRPEQLLQRLGILLIQEVQPSAAVAEAIHHAFDQAQGAAQGLYIFPLVRSDENADLRSAPGKGGKVEVEPELRDLVDQQRQGPGRQAP